MELNFLKNTREILFYTGKDEKLKGRIFQRNDFSYEIKSFTSSSVFVEAVVLINE